MKKILFISHEATATGAPILLLSFMKWLAENEKEIQIYSLVTKHGPLLQEFEKISKKVFYPNKSYTRYLPIVNKYLQKTNEKRVYKEIEKENFDVIFSNTIVNGFVLEKLPKGNSKLVTYIHELGFTFDKLEQLGCLTPALKNVDLYICGSALVQDNLINSQAVTVEKTVVIHSFGEINDVQTKKADIENRLRKELNIHPDSRVVGMMGTLTWRKGFDFFIETAKLLQYEKDIHFIWVGADKKSSEWTKVKFDLKRFKNLKNIKFVEHSSNYQDYFHLIDVFFLSSREDPYPLVVVEASNFGIPTICFENATGSQEFIDEKVGIVVPYGDCKDAANAITKILSKKSTNLLHSNYIKEKSKEWHDINKSAPKLLKLILKEQ